MTNVQFAIESKNETLNSYLNVGTFVKCQYEWDEGFAGIEEATGYHTIQIANGEAQNVSNGYNNPNYPRSIFGCDDNGKVYLITTERSTAAKDGLTAQQANAMMLQYGITHAFQCDGGGSVQSICINESGVLDYAQAPYDGSHRPVLTGTFIIMETEKVTIEFDDLDYDSVTVKLNDLEGIYQGLGIKIASDDYEETYYATDGIIKIDNLKKDTMYACTVLIDAGSGYYESIIKKGFITHKDYPKIKDIQIIKQDKGYIYKINIEDVEEACIRARIYINGMMYNLNNANGLVEVKTNDIYGILNIYLTYDCQFTDVRLTIEDDVSYVVFSSDTYLEHMASLVNGFIEDALS